MTEVCACGHGELDHYWKTDQWRGEPGTCRGCGTCLKGPRPYVDAHRMAPCRCKSFEPVVAAGLKPKRSKQ